MSAITAVQVAIDTAIRGDATIAAKLAGEKVYSLVAPANDTALPYVLLNRSSERRLGVFEKRGYIGMESLSVWSADVSKQECAALVQDLERILDGTTLALTGLTFITGELTVIDLGLDPSLKYSRAILSYEVFSVR